ncbi:MAG: HAD-IIIA family hydrolase [Candidatus Rokuibacteriota bacterium]
MFLDRDGVLVETLVRDGRAYAALTIEQFRICPEARDQVGRLRAARLRPIVFTNQPEVARGTLRVETLEAMHARLREAVDVDDILVCVHTDRDDCACRKPRPGMLQAAARTWQLDLSASFVVGDRGRDIDAGRAVGCYTVLIERPYSECREADARVADLAGAVDAVLARAKDRQ